MKIAVAILGVIIIGVVAFLIFQPHPDRTTENNPVDLPQAGNNTKDTMDSKQESTLQQNTSERIAVRIADTDYAVMMFDNPTAKDLLSQLPLTLPMRDFGGQEKVVTPPRTLTMQGVPKGDDPEANDLGYYAPSNTLVLYYDDVGYFDGIVRLGRFESSLEAIRSLPDGTTITIEKGD